MGPQTLYTAQKAGILLACHDHDYTNFVKRCQVYQYHVPPDQLHETSRLWSLAS